MGHKAHGRQLPEIQSFRDTVFQGHSPPEIESSRNTVLHGHTVLYGYSPSEIEYFRDKVLQEYSPPETWCCEDVGKSKLFTVSKTVITINLYGEEIGDFSKS